jgi:glycosyltransferase involved in cell wall biosynthesis
MRRVAHVITRLDLGGAQQNTLYCLRHHDRSRFQVFLFAGPGGLLDQEALQIDDAHVVLLPALRHPIRPLHDIWAMLQLVDLFSRYQIDLVHTHSSKAGIIGRLAARLAGVGAVVHTAHGWSFNPTQARLLRWLYVRLERLAADRSDRLITVSRADLDRGLSLGIGHRDQYRVIRSGIDIGEYAARPPQPLLQRRPDEVAIGTISCLKPQKDPLTLVRAAALVLDQVPEAHFYIAGDGALRPQVEALAGELGISDRLTLLGWINGVPAFLHDLDIFVLTSRFEGLPRAVLQAAAARVPIVATAVDGTPEVVSNGDTGLLVAPGDSEQIAASIVELTESPELRQRLSEAAYRRVTTGSFAVTQMLAELEEVYGELLGDRPGSGS